jgi:hypothetical protein
LCIPYLKEGERILFDLQILKRIDVKKTATKAISENDLLGALLSAGNWSEIKCMKYPLHFIER